MLAETQTQSFLQTLKPQLLSQIPPSYSPQSTMLSIELPLDMAILLRTHREIALLLISQLQQFETHARQSIAQFMQEKGLKKPQFGINLRIVVNNCMLPVQNVRSGEFVIAAFQRKNGVMVYVSNMVVRAVDSNNLYLAYAEEIWEAKCKCHPQKSTIFKQQQTSLLKLIKQNVQNEDKLKFSYNSNNTNSQPPKCQTCEKNYVFVRRQNQIFLNCLRIRAILPRIEGKQGIFMERQFVMYGPIDKKYDGNNKGSIKPGSIISCCLYLFCKPVITKLSPNQPINLKPSYSAYIVSIKTQTASIGHLAPLHNPQTQHFFSSISKIPLTQKPCPSLSSIQPLTFNYQKLLQSLHHIKFSFIPNTMLSTVKLSLINSIFNHYCITPNPHLNSIPFTSNPNPNVNNNGLDKLEYSIALPLHICITTEDCPLILHTMKLDGLPLKMWPSQYDNTTINDWLIEARNSIVVVVGPNKKDLKFLSNFMDGKMEIQTRITFWVIVDATLKKDINMNYFGVVLDITMEKNMQVCRQAIQECIDLKLSAFVVEQFEHIPVTIVKPKNPRNRLMLTQTHPYPYSVTSAEQPGFNIRPLTQCQLQQQQQQSKRILQLYFLQCRSLRRTSPTTLPHLYKLAKGFSHFRSYLSPANPPPSLFPYPTSAPGTRQPSLSILDTILAILLDEQTCRNKYSSADTIFGIQVSKLVLNQQECQISFWDCVERDDGTLDQVKRYMSKSEMFQVVVAKLRELIVEERDEGEEDGDGDGDGRGRADHFGFYDL